MNKVFVLLVLLVSSGVFAEWKDSSSVSVELISVWGKTGDALIQTNPKATITDLKCTDNYWLTLDKTDPGFQSIMAMLLAAQMSGKTITVRAEDDGVTKSYCRLARVITHK